MFRDIFCRHCTCLCKFPGGVNSFRGHIEDLQAYFEPCLQEAKSHVPSSKHASTPLYLGATAGMRILQWVIWWNDWLTLTWLINVSSIFVSSLWRFTPSTVSLQFDGHLLFRHQFNCSCLPPQSVPLLNMHSITLLFHVPNGLPLLFRSLVFLRLKFFTNFIPHLNQIHIFHKLFIIHPPSMTLRWSQCFFLFIPPLHTPLHMHTLLSFFMIRILFSLWG